MCSAMTAPCSSAIPAASARVSTHQSEPAGRLPIEILFATMRLSLKRLPGAQSSLRRSCLSSNTLQEVRRAAVCERVPKGTAWVALKEVSPCHSISPSIKPINTAKKKRFCPPSSTGAGTACYQNEFVIFVIPRYPRSTLQTFFCTDRSWLPEL